MTFEIIFTYHNPEKPQAIGRMEVCDGIGEKEFLDKLNLEGVAKISLCQIGEDDLLPWMMESNGKYYFD